MIPSDHMLASVNGAMNAVFAVGDSVGETMFYGAGAGSYPTASAVVGDVLELARAIARGERPEAEPEGDVQAACAELAKLASIERVASLIRIEDTAAWAEGAEANE